MWTQLSMFAWKLLQMKIISDSCYYWKHKSIAKTFKILSRNYSYIFHSTIFFNINVQHFLDKGPAIYLIGRGLCFPTMQTNLFTRNKNLIIFLHEKLAILLQILPRNCRVRSFIICIFQVNLIFFYRIWGQNFF